MAKYTILFWIKVICLVCFSVLIQAKSDSDHEQKFVDDIPDTLPKYIDLGGETAENVGDPEEQKFASDKPDIASSSTKKNMEGKLWRDLLKIEDQPFDRQKYLSEILARTPPTFDDFRPSTEVKVPDEDPQEDDTPPKNLAYTSQYELYKKLKKWFIWAVIVFKCYIAFMLCRNCIRKCGNKESATQREEDKELAEHAALSLMLSQHISSLSD